MLFDQESYKTIRDACKSKSKSEIEFEVPRAITAFSSGSAPSEWAAYPPCILPPEGCANVFRHAGSDAQGALTRLELVDHLDGGQILYKAKGSDLVALRVTWPSDA